jgi:putative ubiquitin-RnfH superfamily antitoxin RatB of RatAB toxin-antitoxin module
VDLELAPGATLAQAALASGLWRPESGLALGLWGHRLPGDTPLAGGDRVEIYRPLLIEPKDARRHRAELRRALKPRG